MTTADPPVSPLGPSVTGQEALLWTAAAALAAAAHAGAVFWALRQPPAAPMEAAAAPAVLIDLAPAPVAPPAVEEQIGTDAREAPEIEASPPDQVLAPPPPDAPPPLVPTPPQPVLAAAAPPPAATPLADALPAVEAPAEPPPDPAEPRPLARPPELQVATAPPEPEREQEPEAPSRAAVRAQVQAPPAEAPAAPQNTSGSRGGISPAKWQSRLMAHLERQKRYPAGARRRREEGVAHVHFSIDSQGNVRSAQLVRSSGHAELDEAVLALVRRASPVPAPPPGAPLEITAPVRFDIR